MNIGTVSIDTLYAAAAFAGVSIAFMLIGKWISNALTPYDDDEEIRSGSNLAIALRTTGLYVGLIIGMAGALAGPSAGLVEDLKELSLDGFVVIGSLLFAKAMFHFVTLRGVRSNDEAKRGNLAVGILEFASFTGTGLILNGAFTDVGGTLAGAVIYALIGQVALAVCFLLYEWLTPFNVIQEIQNGNRAAAVAAGVRLIALGAVLNQAIAGPMSNWKDDLTTFGVYFVFGLILLSITNWLADLLFLQKMRVGEAVTSQNVAALMKVAGVQLAAAIIVATVI